jgi:hypothetical protein
MKKIGLLSFVIAAGLSVSAQDPAMGSSSSTPTLRTPMSVVPRFGIKAGANMAKLNSNNFSGGNMYDANGKTSINAGLFANIPIGGLLRFQPELLYNSMGAKVKATTVTTGSTLTESYEQDLTYISLPLMLQVQSPGGFFVEAGPQVSYLVDATKDGPGETETENEPIFDKIDIGASAGIGYMSRVGLGIGARYNFGLTNILDEGQSKDGPELKNRVLSIGLVYQFGANK